MQELRTGGYINKIPLNLHPTDRLNVASPAPRRRKENTTPGQIGSRPGCEPVLSRTEGKLRYELIGVIENTEDHKKRHYIAITRREDSWSRYDDLTTSSMALKQTTKKLWPQREPRNLAIAGADARLHARGDSHGFKKRKLQVQGGQKIRDDVKLAIRDDVKLAQLVRARDCQSRGRWFDSCKNSKNREVKSTWI